MVEPPNGWRERMARVEERLNALEATVDRRIRHLRENVQMLFELDRKRDEEDTATRRFIITTVIATGGLVILAVGTAVALIARL